MENKNLLNKRGQLTIIVIVAIVLVGLIVVFFAVRGNFFIQDIPAEFRPVYSAYTECVEQEVVNGLDILGSQGGRIDFGEIVSGSDYAPFTSQLNFLGIPVPYWYYVTGNNIIRESVPTRNDMEMELESFLEERANNCDMDVFYEQGYYIEFNEPRANVEIGDDNVDVEVTNNIVVTKEERSARKSSHEVQVESKIGKFHDLAVEIYNKQKSEAFLEEYAVDTLRLNAPVDGVSVQCSPQIWQTREVTNELKDALVANIGAVKLRGDYYQPDAQEDNYFILDLDTDESVNFLYSKNFPSKVEVTPADGELMIAKPIGNQEGLGVMGFCYVPYHFVYDVSFPVLIQINDGFEIFQFPVAVIVDNNVPREAESLGYTAVEEDVDVCAFREGEVEVHTFDVNLNPVEADIEYKCFDNICSLGKTELSGSDSRLEAPIPTCVNGELIAKAEGYADKKITYSSNSESIADIILDREYEIEVELLVGGRSVGENLAVVYFVKDDGTSETVVWPDDIMIELSEGSYRVEGFAYGESGITIPGSTTTQCVDVARGGIAGLFGGTKEECHTIEIPPVELEQVLVGGGEIETYILESELQNGKLIVDLDALSTPRNLEELQYNHEAFEFLGLNLRFE